MIYRKISLAFWEGDLANRLRGDADALALAFYLMTCPDSNGIGCYRIAIPTMVDDLGLTDKRVREALAKLSVSPSEGLPEGFLVYDETYRMVWLVEFARHEYGETPNRADNRVKALSKSLRAWGSVSSKSSVWSGFHARYGLTWGALLEALPKPLASPSEALGKPLAPTLSRARLQDQDQDQDQKQDRDPLPERTTNGKALAVGKTGNGKRRMPSVKIPSGLAEGGLTLEIFGERVDEMKETKRASAWQSELNGLERLVGEFTAAQVVSEYREMFHTGWQGCKPEWIRKAIKEASRQGQRNTGVPAGHHSQYKQLEGVNDGFVGDAEI